MLDRATYLGFCERALTSMTDIVRELGDDPANERPDLPGANSPYVILTHCLGVMAYWAGQVNLGRDVGRDRPGEFRATGAVAPLLERASAALEQLRADVSAADPGASPAAPPRDVRPGEDPWLRTQGGVLLHVYEELAQHLGQLEITRDVLGSRASGGVGRSR